uniref:Noggin n=1 Tax=Terebratalia transversa TaxID=34513 RepID=A0A0D4RCZ4_TERTR|nr:noggin [Terebratalia transversa]
MRTETMFCRGITLWLSLWASIFIEIVDLAHVRKFKLPMKSHFYDAFKRLKGTESFKIPLVPSNTLPIQDLIESPDKKLNPKKNNFNEIDMMEFLGKNFNRKYMSVEKPEEAQHTPNGTLVYEFRKNRPTGKMPPSIKNMDFSSNTLDIPGGKNIRTIKLGHKTKRKLQRFLWAYTYCPVLFTWKDLGVRFWPRWIKRGRCYNTNRSCSVPAGMKCNPKGN